MARRKGLQRKSPYKKSYVDTRNTPRRIKRRWKKAAKRVIGMDVDVVLGGIGEFARVTEKAFCSLDNVNFGGKDEQD